MHCARMRAGELMFSRSQGRVCAQCSRYVTGNGMIVQNDVLMLNLKTVSILSLTEMRQLFLVHSLAAAMQHLASSRCLVETHRGRYCLENNTLSSELSLFKNSMGICVKNFKIRV